MINWKEFGISPLHVHSQSSEALLITPPSKSVISTGTKVANKTMYFLAYMIR